MDWMIAALLTQDGLSTGAIYVLLAVSLVLVFAVTRVVNVAQGEFVAFAALTVAQLQDGRLPGTAWLVLGGGAIALAMEVAAQRRLPLRPTLLYLALPVLLSAAAWAAARWSAPYPVVLLLAVALITTLGPIVYRIAFQPIAAASALTLLIAAIALHFVLTGLGLYFFGPEGVRTPALVDGGIELGEMPIAFQPILVILLSGVAMLALYLFSGFTLAGKALRAVALHRRGALLMGIATDRAGAQAFALAALIGALSGVLIGPMVTIYYDSGFLLGLKGFVGAIVGALSLYPAAAAGALLVGMIEAFGSFWASAYKEVIVFTLILPVLLWRWFAAPVHEDAHD